MSTKNLLIFYWYFEKLENLLKSLLLENLILILIINLLKILIKILIYTFLKYSFVLRSSD